MNNKVTGIPGKIKGRWLLIGNYVKFPPMNLFGSVCHFCLTNKKISFLVFAGIILWGSVSFIIAPKRYNPDIVAPAFQVQVNFPGHSSQEVFELITKPLENVVAQLPGVDEIYSQSLHGGQSVVTVKFFVGEDMDKSKIRLRQRIDSNMNLKPIGVTEIRIISIDPDDLPVMTLALTSDSLGPVELRRRAFRLRDQLKHVSGTSEINIVGGRQREFQIILDPDKLRISRTSIQEVEDALKARSLLETLGNIKQKKIYLPIETSGTVRNISEIENLVISSNVERKLKVKDIGQVVEGEREDDTYANYYFADQQVEPAVFVSIAKKKGRSISSVTARIHEELAKLQKEVGWLQDLKVVVLRDEGRVAKEEISGLTLNLLQAITIVLFLLFFFLNIRAAIVVAISIPLTLLTVIGIGNLAGYTINRITLFALILSLGLLVDSATVVVENIVRNKQKYPEKSKIGVIVQSVSEVGSGLLLSTITTVLAFIPLGFVTGMMGPYMGPLPFFVSGALIVSLIYAYTITPWLASVLCREKSLASEDKRLSVKLFSRLMAHYTVFMNWLFAKTFRRRAFLLICLGLIVIVLSFPVLEWLKFRMLPKADREQIYVYLDLNEGTSLERTLDVSRKIAGDMKKEKEITSVQSFVGMPPILDFNGMFKGASGRGGTHQATLRLNLTHKDDRKLKSEDLALIYRQKILETVGGIPDAVIQVIEDPPGPPVRSTFFVKVQGEDAQLIRDVSLDLAKKVAEIAEVVDVDTSNTYRYSKYTLRVLLEEAAVSRVNTAQIATLLKAFYEGSEIGIFHDESNVEQEYITLKFPRSDRDDIKDLDRVFIMNDLGNPIPVTQFVTTEKVPADEVIYSDDRIRTAYISAEMGKRSVTYASIDFLKLLSDYKLPTGNGKRTSLSLLGTDYKAVDGRNVNVRMDGEWKMTLEVFRDLGLAMLVAIALIYFVMVAQFRSYLIPLLILGTIPLALIGVFPGFAFLYWVGGIYFSATSMIGVIALSGIVVNNAIILLEYITQRSQKGGTFKQAIVEAGAIRMRPIILTSLTTILGSLAIAWDPVWSGLAWSIVFGLSLSSILTLIVFPTLLYHFVGETGFVELIKCEN